ncbi:MAG: YafY family protein [Phycisphaerae bacterium]|nr:YafY family protein [Phycisphaerae bacterium]
MSVSRVHRLLRVITLLRAQRAPTVADLAEQLEVSRRTVFRDLNMLELAGVPYYHDASSGGYRIANTFFLPPVNLTLDEALALMTVASQSRQLPLHELTEQASAKIESVLPRTMQAELRRAMQGIRVDWPAQARHKTVTERFDVLQRAIVEHRKLRLTYVSFFEKSLIQTDLSPYQLFYFQRAWYVVGLSQMHNQVRTFKLGRIKGLAPLDKLYLADEQHKFSLEAYLGNAWGMIPEGREYQVRLRFSPKVAANVAEVNWHRTQQTQFDRDGSAVFSATVDGLGEISWWILGYGDQVEVLAPAALRSRVRKMAQAVVDRYQPTASADGEAE